MRASPTGTESHSVNGTGSMAVMERNFHCFPPKDKIQVDEMEYLRLGLSVTEIFKIWL